MLTSAIILALTAANGANAELTPLDLHLKPILDACVLPDMSITSPESEFAAAGWTKLEGGWLSDDQRTVVMTTWPRKGDDAAGCSVYSTQYSAAELHSWFAGRIGEANSIPWDPETPIAAWRININDHPAAIYVAHDHHPETGATSPVIHILQ